MLNLRISTRTLAVTGLTCFGSVAFLTSCGGNGSSGSSPTPGVTPLVNSNVTCASGTGGVAFIPDGAAGVNSGGGTAGSLTVIPFEDNKGVFQAGCPQIKLSLPVSINDFVLSTQGIGIALQSDNRFIAVNQLVYGGSPNTFQNSQAFPAYGGSQFIASSLAVVPNGNSGFVVGTPFSGFVGINNLFGLAPTPIPTVSPAVTPSATPVPTIAPPGTTPSPTVTQTPVPYPGLVQYRDIASTTSKSTGLEPVNGTRTSVSLAPNGSTVLVRGVDLATFSFVSTIAGYYFAFPAQSGSDITSVPAAGINTTLGFYNGTPPAGNAGQGLIAFFPNDSSQAVIGQTSMSATTATRVTGLPNNISTGTQFTVPNTITSVAVVPGGSFAFVGTPSGIFAENLGANATTAVATSVTTGPINSVRVSADGKFVLAHSGNVLNVYSLTTNNNSATLTPAGSFALPATTSGDYMVVR